MLQRIAVGLVLAEVVLVVAALRDDVRARAVLVGRARADRVGVPLQLAREPRPAAAEGYLRQPGGPGDYLLVARATDRAGGLQDSQYRDTAPEGATGYPGLHVRISN